MQVQADYTRGNDLLHMCYDFEFLANAYPTGYRVAAIMEKFNEVVSDGWACWAYSNHDVVRHTSRWNLNVDQQKLYAGLLMSIKGSVCLYQGEELGLTEAYVAYEDLQDPYGKQFWPKFKGRDGSRTPFPWNDDAINGGFSDQKPWLPVAVEHLEKAVRHQEDQPDSVLNFYRNMLAFRKAHPALLKGDIRVLAADDLQISFMRTYENAELFCFFNLSDSPMMVQLPGPEWQLDRGAPFKFKETAKGIDLPPHQAVFALNAEQNG
jgi:alpha-glucosidase